MRGAGAAMAAGTGSEAGVAAAGVAAAGSAAAFTVVRGNPAPDELAALAVVLLGLAPAADPGPERPPASPLAAWRRLRRAAHRCPRSWHR